MEMKRSFSKGETAGRSPSTSVSANSKTKNQPARWIFAAGVIMAICVLAFGAVWGGYRLYTRPVPVTGASLSSPTLTVAAPTETASGTPTDAPVEAEASVEPNIPAPDILARYLNDVQIIQVDTFDNPSESDWNVQAGKIENGVMEINGNDNYDGAWYPSDFSDNEGVLIDFNFIGRSTFLVYLNFGSYGTDPFRRFGIYIENSTTPITDIYGPDYIWGGYLGTLSVVSDKVYTLLLAILPNGEILNVIWDPEDLTETLEFRNRYDETWAGLLWTLVIQAQNGAVNFDNFRVIQFNGGK
ncbi:MAG: hypothetical protein HXY35_14870 [Chloroflexi bacterium]|nr:hypothetical protein [Chloroflexota bacterium]